jgi:hypothetical protein
MVFDYTRAMRVSRVTTVVSFCVVFLLLGCATSELERSQQAWLATNRVILPPPTAHPLVSTNVSVPPKAAPATNVAVATNTFRWRQLESEDYPTYIARLRAIGCPEETIRDIIIADLDKLTAPRMEFYYRRRPDLQFWHSEEEELANERDPRELSRLQRELDREKRAVVEELLGVDLVRERIRSTGHRDYYERRLSFLPEHRRSAVRKVLEKYDELEQQIREKEWDQGEPLNAQDRAKLGRVREQEQAELAATMTPEEREQYELWMSETANAVRHATYGMNASREEFLTIYQLQKSFDEQWAGRDVAWMDDTTRQRWQEAKQQMEMELLQKLGAARFADYKRGHDPDFHHMAATATRFGLPPDTAKKLYELKRASQNSSKALENNRELTVEQREATRKATLAETERTARQLLGDTAFKYYLRRGQADWLSPNQLGGS